MIKICDQFKYKIHVQTFSLFLFLFVNHIQLKLNSAHSQEQLLVDIGTIHILLK